MKIYSKIEIFMLSASEKCFLNRKKGVRLLVLTPFSAKNKDFRGRGKAYDLGLIF